MTKGQTAASTMDPGALIRLQRNELPPEPKGRLIDEGFRHRRGSPVGGNTPLGTPMLGPRLCPRPCTPIPTHSNTPPPESLDGSRRPSLLMPPDADSRRGSLTKKALTGMVTEAKKGIKNVTDSSMDAGRKVRGSTRAATHQVAHKVTATAKKVKDKTVTVSGQMKDMTVGASMWVATQTSKTAKAAVEQAKSGLSIGEKFTLFASEKISVFSRRGFTHVFLFVILMLYTAMGGAIFKYVEGGYEASLEEDRRVTVDDPRNQFLNDQWDFFQEKRPNHSDWNITMTNLLVKYEAEVIKSHKKGLELEAKEPDWTFLRSMFFCTTITTTIGYGHIAPQTQIGRIITIVYAILGIPIFLILLADFGKLFTRGLKCILLFLKRCMNSIYCRRLKKSRAVRASKAGMRQAGGWWSSLWWCCKRKKSEEEEPEEGKKKKEEGEKEEEEDDEEADAVDDNFNLPVSLALIILIIYMTIGCIVYPIWEDWTYFEACYFIFISMTTIGFGDYVPKHPAYMMLTTLYMLFGLALTAMCINIIQEKLTDTFRHASEKLKESLGELIAQAAQGEDAGLPEGKEVEIAEVHGEMKKIPPTDTVEVKKET